MKHVIESLEADCILEQMGVEAGDSILEINGKKIKDIFDYRFFMADEYIEALIEKKNGEQWLLEIDKDEGEDLGACFSQPMMAKANACSNNCIFCFIDQLPQGMRETLYFKDDDSRLSFLAGNYVTLTNIGAKELDRLVNYKLSPINVSVHTTDPDLRIKMLRNKNAGKIKEQLKKISQAGIEINCQIVLVKGVNDGERLAETISDLLEIEGIRSVSAVPVGLTKHREKLTELKPFEKNDALNVIEIIHSQQLSALRKRENRFIYAADEFYIKAGLPLPDYAAYDDFPQLENGIGMSALFEKEFTDKLKKLRGDSKTRRISVVTGKIALPLIEKLSQMFAEKFTKTEIKVIMVVNDFFGEEITVSGLLTGRDVRRVLKNKNIKGRVLLPTSCFRAETEVFLDGVCLSDLNAELEILAVPVPVDGGAFAMALMASKEADI